MLSKRFGHDIKKDKERKKRDERGREMNKCSIRREGPTSLKRIN
jgi:hypothetical protein